MSRKPRSRRPRPSRPAVRPEPTGTARPEARPGSAGSARSHEAPGSRDRWIAEHDRLLEAKAAALATLGQAEMMERTAAALRTHALAILDRLAVDEVEHTAELTGAAASGREHELARRSLVAEVATMTTQPEARVSGHWSRAVTCMREQPQTADALLAAEIGAEHAKVLVDELGCVSARGARAPAAGGDREGADVHACGVATLDRARSGERRPGEHRAAPP